MGTTEMLVRNATTPPLDYDDVSKAEIDAKIRLTETWVRRVFFEGSSLPDDATDAVVLIVLSNILSRSDLARKYGTLTRERLGDYEYEKSGPMSRGAEFQADPNAVLVTWHNMAIAILKDLSAAKKYQMRITNE